MKKWILLWTILFLGFNSLGNPHIAIFDRLGFVSIKDTPPGILVGMNMHAEPRQKYMIKLLSDCQIISPFRMWFRHSFETQIISGKDGIISRSIYFLGMHDRDLKSRNLNTLAFYKLEKSYWKMVKCVALEDIRSGPSDRSDIP